MSVNLKFSDGGMLSYTVVPAQPGFYVVTSLDGGLSAAPEPIIAWAVELVIDAELGSHGDGSPYGLVDPITVSGFSSRTGRNGFEAIMHPNGRIVKDDAGEWESVTDYLAWVREECERIAAKPKEST